jgi:ParB family transcriptional regulator, chromosome partitioning protein
MGHARVLAGLKTEEEQLRLRDRILKSDLSVRQAEASAKTGRTRKQPPPQETEKAVYLQAVTDELKRSLGTKVEIKEARGKGTVVIHFYSDDELGRLIEKLGG